MSVNDAEVAVADQPSRKVRVRAGHKSHFTKMKTDIDTLIAGTAADKNDRLLALKGCLQRKATVISDLDAEILDEIDVENIAVEIEILLGADNY